MKHPLELCLGLPGQGCSPRKRHRITEQHSKVFQDSLVQHNINPLVPNEEAEPQINPLIGQQNNEAASLISPPLIVDVSVKNKPTRSWWQIEIENEHLKEENKKLKEENLRFKLQAWKGFMHGGK